MIKRTVAFLLATFVITSLFTACAEKENVSSSVNEDTYSEITTSAVNESEISNEDTASKTITPSDAASTSSVKVPSKNTASTVSLNIKTYKAKKTAEILAYHFQPYYTSSYGSSVDRRLDEFEDVIAAGYFNSFITANKYFDSPRLWQIVKKYNVKIWYSCYSYFESKKESIDTWIARVDKAIKPILEDKELSALFQGFHFDEPIWRGESNADFITMTKALYQKYGRRTFPVLSTGEFSDWEGNSQQLNLQAENMKKIDPQAFRYVTDIGFDSYSIDVRKGAGNGSVISDINATNPKIYDGRSYYKEYANILREMSGDYQNMWFFPCAYTTSLWGGLNGIMRADEEYCMAQLQCMAELLAEQKYQGGLCLYTYTQFSNEKEFGLQSTLVVEKDGEQVLRPYETPLDSKGDQTKKWKKYSLLIKKLTTQFREKEVKQADY